MQKTKAKVHFQKLVKKLKMRLEKNNVESVDNK